MVKISAVVYLFCSLLLLVSACSPSETPIDESSDEIEESTLMSDEEDTVAKAIPEQPSDESDMNNTESEEIVEQIDEPQGLTGSYLDTIQDKVKYYAFDYEYLKSDGTTGSVWVFRKDDWQVIEGALWEVNLTTNELTFLDDQRFVKIENYLEEKKEERDERTERDNREGKPFRYNETHHLANYVWINLTSGETKACWIHTRRNQWNSEECKSYENHSDTIIYDGLQLDRLLYLPEYWLVKFRGSEPLDITEGMTYKDGRGFQTQVNRIKFSSGINAETILYVQSTYGIPLKVEEMKNNKVVSTTTYLYMTINYPKTERWYPDFLTP